MNTVFKMEDGEKYIFMYIVCSIIYIYIYIAYTLLYFMADVGLKRLPDYFQV